VTNLYFIFGIFKIGKRFAGIRISNLGIRFTTNPLYIIFLISFRPPKSNPYAGSLAAVNPSFFHRHPMPCHHPLLIYICSEGWLLKGPPRARLLLKLLFFFSFLSVCLISEYLISIMSAASNAIRSVKMKKEKKEQNKWRIERHVYNRNTVTLFKNFSVDFFRHLTA
jgi:hypothetical protein